MAREQMVYAYGVTMLAVPAGYSNCVLVTGVSGQVWSALKYASGSSLEIMQCAPGASVPVQTAAGQGYMLGTNEVINTDGAARYYLCATGATGVAYLLRGLSDGFQ